MLKFPVSTSQARLIQFSRALTNPALQGEAEREFLASEIEQESTNPLGAASQRSRGSIGATYHDQS
jgi:hypothetical protein